MKKLLPIFFISAAFGSLSASAWADNLAQIYELAKKNDPQLLGIEAVRDNAFEAVNSSRSSLLPQINLTAGYKINESDESIRNSKAYSAGINFTQELYQRSSWLSLGTAEKKARQADARYAAAQQNLIMRVSNAYFEVLRAKDNLAFVQSEKNAVGRQLDQTKQRFEVGLSAITDVHDAQAQYDAVLADEILAKNKLTNSYESLREITGEEPTHLSVLDTERFSTSRTEETVHQLLEQAEKKNLTLLASRIGKDIAKDQIALAKSKNLPSLTLDGGYNYNSEQDSDYAYYDTYAGHDTKDLSVGINLSVPLYTGGNLTSLSKQAEFSFVKASQDLEAQYRSVIKDVRAYNNNISASVGAVKAYQQALVSAKSALKATQAGFEVGTRTIVDVLDATRRLYDANKNLADARYDYILSVLQLHQATGTLSEQDVLDINAGLKKS
ncbi:MULTISPECIES: outer membrane channel protein TolC [Vibrio]|uniref:Outer membrane channel protein TolC n=2 Tax=Vibrio TaxID=662 RepID=A0A7X4RTK4_9VIBR|nr:MULTISPECIES: outer membrane channel protein TolC [Vibrio]MBF9001611.1 outer membrane channel protein TolC [Vibrio nitrifigilis]MZI92528.1 outer membrane channel protein TolC [Vibrio eleionomae]